MNYLTVLTTTGTSPTTSTVTTTITNVHKTLFTFRVWNLSKPLFSWARVVLLPSNVSGGEL